MLTQSDVEFFRANGYLLPEKPLLAPERLDTLESIFNAHLADKGDTLSDEARKAHLSARLADARDKPSDELDTPHCRDRRLLDFLLADEVLDVVEPLVGPDIALWTSHFISKEPFKGRPTPWHEDSAYWNGRLSAYDRIVTIWLALGPSNRENGCMRVIPGTHLGGGFSEYRPVDQTVQTFHAEITKVDESKAVDFALERGQFSTPDGRTTPAAERP